MKHAPLWLLVTALFILALPARATRQTFPLREDGSISLWTVTGPLPDVAAPGCSAQCGGFYTDYLAASAGERGATPAEGDGFALKDGRRFVWKTVFSGPTGLLDYNEIFAVTADDPAVAYAFCWVTSDKARDVLLKIRSNDGVRVWLNQTLVHENHTGRTIDAAEDLVPVTLQPGDNRLLVKVDQTGGGWGLLLRILGVDGQAAPGVGAAVSMTAPLNNALLGATFTATPFVRNTPEGERQVISGKITSGGVEKLVCQIENAAWPAPHVADLGKLSLGEHRVEIVLPPLAEKRALRVTLQAGDTRLVLPDFDLAPARRWTIDLVQHVHTDIGYTRPQTEILPEHLRYIDYALDYCDLTDNYPDEAKFRWTCETTWAVREYLRRRPAEQIARLKRRVAEGRIEIAGMFLNMSEIATESSLAASLQPIREIREKLGASVQIALQNDVNGIGWCLADYFESIGVKYLIMGINETRSVLPFERPTHFWWESPSGHRVLAYRADHYHTGNMLGIHLADMRSFKPGIETYLNRLEKLAYPFDIASIQYSGYHTDNSPPAMKECDLIREWNATYAWPKLRSATAGETMQAIEKKHGSDLPVLRQSWPDWWTDGFGSAARETAASRQTHAAMQTNETLLAMAALLGAPPSAGVGSRIQAVHENLNFYDEHTFGASESISDPLVENSMVQWGEKSSYVWSAVKDAGLVREEALGVLQSRLPRVDVPTMAVFNTLNWARSGLVEVFIDEDILPRDRAFRIVDPEDGTALAAQALRNRSEGTYWAIWVKNVPPLGYKSFRIEVSDQPAPGAPDAVPQAAFLENAWYRLDVDPVTGGLLRLLDKQTMSPLVDETASWRFGQILRETLPDRGEINPAAIQRMPMNNVKVLPGSNGPIWKSIQIEGDLEGCEAGRGVRAEIRLYETEPRIEFHFTLRKLPVAAPEAIYVAFPFSVPGGEIRYEGQGGLVRPGKDQIPGSASDWQTVQHFAVIRDSARQIVFGSDAVPLVQLGGLNLGKWQAVTTVEKPHIYSWVMNNYWFTNFRATQEGEFKWHYYLGSKETTSNTEATRFGWGSRIAMIPRVLPPGTQATPESMLSTLDLGVPNLVLVDARPAFYGEGIVLHLRELEGKATELDTKGLRSTAAFAAIEETNLLEEVVAPHAVTVSFAPYESKFLKLTLK
ncbi:MAG: hypothetical protein HYV27_07430 [Candidatus Hydrogenedentes bacterium]|nr:hypothetical protein [Candidatus Hydrogenedentota bacterium]